MPRLPIACVLAGLLFAAAGCSGPAHEPAAGTPRPPAGDEAPPAAAVAALEPLTYEQEQLATELLVRKAACDRFVPGFREQSARAFAAWRRVRPAEVQAIESRPGFTAQVAAMDRVAAAGGGANEELQGDALIAIFEAEGRPADASLATPESAWREFLGALARADRARALACMSAAAQQVQRSQLSGIPDETMRETGASFERLELVPGSGTSRAGTAFRRDGTAHPVAFERTWNGDWRIASY